MLFRSLGYGGIAEGLFKMALGNRIGFKLSDKLTLDEIFGYGYGGIVAEVSGDVAVDSLVESENILILGETSDNYSVTWRNEVIALKDLESEYEDKLESVYKCNIDPESKPLETFNFTEQRKTPEHAPYYVESPKVLIPVFPGTNCEYDSVVYRLWSTAITLST